MRMLFLCSRILEDAAPCAGEPLYNVSVEMEPGRHSVLLSTEIYSFRSGATGEDQSNAETPSMCSPSTDIVAHKLDEQIAASLALGQACSRNSQADCDAPSGPAVSSHTSPVTTSREMLVSAVRDMLAAADLPLDLDSDRLLAKCMALENKLTKAEEDRLKCREAAGKAAEERDAVRESWECKVCRSCEVEFCFMKCGHMLCEPCASRQYRCPNCRQVSHKLRLIKS